MPEQVAFNMRSLNTLITQKNLFETEIKSLKTEIKRLENQVGSDNSIEKEENYKKQKLLNEQLSAVNELIEKLKSGGGRKSKKSRKSRKSRKSKRRKTFRKNRFFFF